MKKLLLLLIVISFSAKTKAQIVFCPPGAEWHYLFTQFWPNMGTMNRSIKYVGDQIEGNDTVKILNHTMFFLESGGGTHISYIKQKGDTIFIRNHVTENQWQILYNFSALPGHSWTNSFYPSSTNPINYTVTVTSVQTKLFDNKMIKELTVNYTNSYGPTKSSSGTISEYYGFSGYLFNFIRQVTKGHGSYLMAFLCYSDSINGEHQFSDYACGYSNATAIDELSLADLSLKIYPNPCKEILILERENSNTEIKLSILDLHGREIKKMNLHQKNEIDLRDLKAGIYFVRLESKSGTKTVKILKE